MHFMHFTIFSQILRRFLLMATVKKENPVLNQTSTHLIDTMWDGYVNGMKMIFSSQKEMEKLMLDAVSQQQSNIEVAQENFNKVEQELRKMMDEMRQSVETNISKVGGEQVGKSVADWNKRLDEIAKQIQTLSLTPNKATVEYVEQFQSQWQDMINRYTSQQEKTRNEMETLASNFFNHVKDTQKGIANAVQANTEYAMSFLSNK